MERGRPRFAKWHLPRLSAWKGVFEADRFGMRGARSPEVARMGIGFMRIIPYFCVDSSVSQEQTILEIKTLSII